MLLVESSNIMASMYIEFEKILYNLECHYKENYVLEKGLKG